MAIISQQYSSPKKNESKALEIKKKLQCKKSSPLKIKCKKVIQNALKNVASKAKQAPVNKCMDSVRTSHSTMKRAQEVQANLSSEFPSCIKPMLLSHVTGGFWLSLPRPFASIHMPKEGEHMYVLVNEDGAEYETKYLARKNGLSGGWRGFSIAHKLVEGDVLVFQLIQPSKFKVYIVRANNLTELDGAIGLLTLDNRARSSAEKDETENVMEISEDEDGYFNHPIPLKICEDKIDGSSSMASETELGTTIEHNENGIDVSTEEFQGIRFSDSVPDFGDVKDINSFTIHVDGLIIDSEIPPHLRVKYYDLCCSQKKFLHNNLLKGLNLSLVSGIISETVNIADAIRACRFTITKDDLMTWDQTLQGFEKLGLTVNFLRARIERLVNLAFRSKTILETKKVERVKAEDEIRMHEAKISDLKVRVKRLDSEIECLMGENALIEVMFTRQASASW